MVGGDGLGEGHQILGDPAPGLRCALAPVLNISGHCNLAVCLGNGDPGKGAGWGPGTQEVSSSEGGCGGQRSLWKEKGERREESQGRAETPERALCSRTGLSGLALPREP